MTDLERHVRQYMVAVTRGDHEAQIAAYEAMYDDLTPPAATPTAQAIDSPIHGTCLCDCVGCLDCRRFR